MMKNTFILLILSTTMSCGIYQSYFGEPNYDPEIERKVRIELSKKKENITRDSINNLIKSASIAVPSNLHSTTLIVETYSYNEFLKLSEDRFHSPVDSKKYRRYYQRYSKSKNQLLQDYQHPIIYAEKIAYDTFDLEQFRYVLKSTYQITTDENEVLIYKDGTAGGYVALLVYYIYDRKLNTYYKWFNDITILTQGSKSI